MKQPDVVSLFAGIGGFDLGFDHAGFRIVGHVEKDANCRKLLGEKWPDAVCLDDVCTVGKHNLPPCDVVTFGFPCQDLSVAGKRAGLAGGRSGLFYEATRIIDELKPAYCIFENVPGLLSSDGGRDFWRVLRQMDEIGYHGAWRTLDAQWFGVAQRRRRVFGLFSRLDSGAERCAEVLSLGESLRGHPAPSRETGKVAPCLAASGVGAGRTGNERNEVDFCIVAGTLDGKCAAANRGSQANEAEFIVPEKVNTLTSRMQGSSGWAPYNETEHLIPEVAGTLSCNTGPKGHDAGNFASNQSVDAGYLIPEVVVCLDGECGGGKLQVQHANSGHLIPEVANTFRMQAFGQYEADGTASAIKQRDHKDATDLVVEPKCFGIDEEQNAADNLMGCLKARKEGGGFEAVPVAFRNGNSAKTRSMGESNDLSPTIPSESGGNKVCVSFAQNQLGEVRTGEVAGTINTNSNASGRNTAMAQVAMSVRRLTPVECERLQGFPDGWTESACIPCVSGLVYWQPTKKELSCEQNAKLKDAAETLWTEKTKYASCTISAYKGAARLLCQNETAPMKSANHADAQFASLQGGGVSDATSHGKDTEILLKVGEGQKPGLNQCEVLTKKAEAEEAIIFGSLNLCLVENYSKERLSTILTWTSETTLWKTFLFASPEEHTIKLIIRWNSRQLHYSSGDLFGFALESITPFSDSTRYKMLGNAVCVNVSEWIAFRLIAQMEKS